MERVYWKEYTGECTLDRFHSGECILEKCMLEKVLYNGECIMENV